MNQQTVCGFFTVLSGLLAIAFIIRLDGPGRRWLGWQRKLLFSSLMVLTITTINAQSTWTARPQTGDKQLSDVAYGAGTYVAVGGDDGLIRISPDGITWTNQVAGTTSANGLSAIVYAAGKFVIVGNNGRVLTSTDGLTWTPQVSGGSALLQGVTYGGGQFVAVGFSGAILTSPDGVTWTARTADPSANSNLQFQEVTYGGGKFVAVGGAGLIQTSLNGITWTTRTASTAAELYGVTAGGNGSFVAVGTGSTVVTSPDGITWTPQTMAGPSTFIISATYNPATGQFVAVAATGNSLFTSPNGLTWTAHPSGTSASLKGVRYLNGQYMAVGDYGAIRSSPDGTTWKPLTITGQMHFEGAAYGNGRYVAVGSYPTDPAVQTSTISLAVTSGNGLNYEFATTQDPTGTNNGLQDVVFGNGLFVAVGKNAGIQTSADGSVWQLRYDNAPKSLNAITYGGGQFVAVGDAGLVLRSTNGLTWAPGSSSPNTNYLGITYANGQFVAVGQGGVIGTSPDGIAWTARTSGTNNSLTGVVYGNGVFVAVGIGGKVFRSADGVTWSGVVPFTTYAFYAVTFVNGLFVVVGEAFNSESTLATSPDGITWTALASKTFYTLRGVTHGNGLFVAVGDYSTFTTSPDDGGVPPVNQAPTVASSIPNQVATVGQPFSYGIPAGTFSDPNGDALTLSIGGLPNGLTLNGTTIIGTPTTVEAPTVTATATDPGNLAVSTQFTITVSAAVVNPPADPGSLTITAFTCHTANGLLSSVDFVVGYANGTFLPAVSDLFINGVTITGQLGKLYTFSFDVNAAPPPIQDQASRSTYFVWDYRAACLGGQPPLPTAPVVPVLPNQIATVGSGFNYVVPAFGGSAPITYSAAGLPSGLSFEATTRTISGVPITVQAPTVAITAINAVGQNTGLFTITVNPAVVIPPANPGSLTITDYICHYTASVLSSVDFWVGHPGGIFTPAVPDLFINGVTITGQLGQLYTFSFDVNAAPLPIQDQASRSTYFVWDFRAGCPANGARVGVESLTPWQVSVLGNPVGSEVVVVIANAQGQSLQLDLVDVAGHVVDSRGIVPVSAQQREVFYVAGQGAGLLVVRVVGDTHRQTLKVIKQ